MLVYVRVPPLIEYSHNRTVSTTLVVMDDLGGRDPVLDAAVTLS